MKKIFFIAVIVLVVLGITYVIGYEVNDDKTRTVDVAGVFTARGEIMPDKYFYPNNFYSSIDLSSTLGVEFQTDKVRAGIIPHDITQGQMMAHFFQGLSIQNPKRIILLGPNHFEVGGHKLITTTADWQTDFGLVTTEDEVIEELLKNSQFGQDSEIIANEHSVSAIAPYISYYLPGIQVVPIIFRADIRQNEINALIELLDTYIDEDTVLVAAVDFSHNLNKDQASLNDIKTKIYLQNLDYQSVINLGEKFNDYLDSPAVIGLLLKWLDQKGFRNNQIISQTNSSEEVNDPSILTTSYFEVIYY